MTKLVIVRHAEAEGNYKRLFQGHFDADISEKGKKQLDLLSIRCRNMERSVIYSSPLKRARAIEINGGVWENKPWKELPELYPEEAHHWLMEPWAFAPLQGEPMTHVYDRIYGAVRSIASAHRGETVFVVTHGVAIRNLVCRLKYHDIRMLNEVYWCDNTALSVLEIDDNDRWNLSLVGDASHLDKETSTLANQVWWRPENRDISAFA